MKKPKFIIIGAQKCGTSALRKYAQQHPDIYMYPVEASFYSDDRFFKKGYKAYESRFPDNIIGGDKTPDYLFLKHVPKRIYAHNPDVKLVAILRDPVNRMYSQYCMYHRTARFDESFPEFIHQCFHDVVARSRYMPQIKRYLAFFQRRQLKIYFTEEFYVNRQATMDDLFNFLGVKSHHISNLKDHHVGVGFKSELLRTLVRYINTGRDKTPWFRLRRPLYYMGHLINTLNKNQYIKYPPIDEESKARYRHLFFEDIDELELFLNRKVPWIGYR